MGTEILVAILGGTIPAVTMLIGQIIEARAKILAESKKKGETPPTAPKMARQLRVNLWIVIGVWLAVALVVLGIIFWIWPILAGQLPSTLNAFVDSFEGKDIAPEWHIRPDEVNRTRSRDNVFAGLHSLTMNVELAEHLDLDDPAGTVELVLKGRDLQNKLAIARVYAPEGAPTNLYAGLFIVDDGDQWVQGPDTKLPAGKWSTLVWSTQDAPDWKAPAELGIQFTLAPRVPGLTTDQAKYSGPIYVDLVEVLTLPDVYSGGPSLDRILQPLVFDDFERITTVPNNIEPAGVNNTRAITLTDEEKLPDGQKALKLDLELEPYDNEAETGYGGIYVDLGDGIKRIKRVEALSVSLFVPRQSNTENGGFWASFVAVDADEDWVYSPSSPIQVGEWSPVFWGTRYAFSGSDLCKDSDGDDYCDQPAGIWWHAWRETDIMGFYLRVWRYDENYQGPVYIDNLGVYQHRP